MLLILEKRLLGSTAKTLCSHIHHQIKSLPSLAESRTSSTIFLLQIQISFPLSKPHDLMPCCQYTSEAFKALRQPFTLTSDAHREAKRPPQTPRRNFTNVSLFISLSIAETENRHRPRFHPKKAKRKTSNSQITFSISFSGVRLSLRAA